MSETLIGLRVEAQILKFNMDLFNIEIFQGYTLVKDGFHIWGVLVSYQDFITHFLDEALFHNMAYIDDFLLMKNFQVALDILFWSVSC
jgi:hypothetical protein